MQEPCTPRDCGSEPAMTVVEAMMGGSPVVLAVVTKRAGAQASRKQREWSRRRSEHREGRNAYTGVKPTAGLTGGARGRSFAPGLACLATCLQARGGSPTRARLRALLLKGAPLTPPSPTFYTLWGLPLCFLYFRCAIIILQRNLIACVIDDREFTRKELS
jgi:hypothetical protein